MQEVFQEVEQAMVKAVKHFHEELKQLRTGRASPAILDGVMVEYYGTPTPLRQLANINVAESTLLTAQPFDVSQLGAIERAIMMANLGLNPSNDGKIIRIPVPPLTSERRQELVRRAHEMAEATRTGIRQARRDGNDFLKAMEKDKDISQDDERRGLAEVQKLHDHYIGKVAETLAAKEKDITTL
ncbi:MAG: ribosome recycling factor [Acidobacteriota bacterium]